MREKGGDRDVRNLGMPVDLAARYFEEGADEVTFLNITGFRDCPLADMPMLEVCDLEILFRSLSSNPLGSCLETAL